jgi:aerotaxis receptor
MIKPDATQEERQFSINEMFFSRTDLKGIITFANDVFIRISGYPKSEIEHAPHNIIRHPDMPKAVFKLLWNTIQSGEVIVAYVKNMSADGSFYWVLATVLPLGDEYLSIRIKPTSPLLRAVEEIYKKVLIEETEKGVEASRILLMELVEGAGFKDYKSFMIEALVTELKALDNQQTKKIEKYSKHKFCSELSMLSENSLSKYKEIFYIISGIQQSNFDLESKTKNLFDQFIDFQLVSLNMRVLAGRMGSDGAAIGVLSENFQKIISGIELYLSEFSQNLKDLLESIHSMNLEISLVRLQVQMISFFIQEYLNCDSDDAQVSSIASDQLNLNSNIFTVISRTYSKKISTRVYEIQKQLDNFVRGSNEMKKITNTIGIMSQMGSIETARINQDQHSFLHASEEMIKLHGILLSTATDINYVSKNLSQQVSLITITLETANKNFNEFVSRINNNRFDKMKQMLA